MYMHVQTCTHIVGTPITYHISYQYYIHKYTQKHTIPHMIHIYSTAGVYTSIIYTCICTLIPYTCHVSYQIHTCIHMNTINTPNTHFTHACHIHHTRHYPPIHTTHMHTPTTTQHIL